MFSRSEIKDFVISTVMLSLIFGILIFRGTTGTGLAAFGEILLIAFITVGISFICHELAHKFTAIKFNCITEFRTDLKMLGVGLFMAIFLPFILFSPGGVAITNVRSKRHMGLIALAGPIVTLLFGLGFAAAFFATGNPIAYYGFFINSWLAFFNMLPFGGFDGQKVLDWNRTVYFVFAGITLLLFVGQYLPSYL